MPTLTLSLLPLVRCLTRQCLPPIGLHTLAWFLIAMYALCSAAASTTTHIQTLHPTTGVALTITHKSRRLTAILPLPSPVFRI